MHTSLVQVCYWWGFKSPLGHPVVAYVHVFESLCFQVPLAPVRHWCAGGRACGAAVMTIRTASAIVPALQMPVTTIESSGRGTGRPCRCPPCRPPPSRKHVVASTVWPRSTIAAGLPTRPSNGRWVPGARLNVEETSGVIAVRADARDVFTMSNQRVLTDVPRG